MLSQLSWYVLQGDAEPRRKRFGETSIRYISLQGWVAVINPMIGPLLLAHSGLTGVFYLILSVAGGQHNFFLRSSLHRQPSPTSNLRSF